MAFYDTCPLCGANLDPNEKCDCQDEKEREAQKMQGIFRTGRGGQIQMNFIQEVAGSALYFENSR